MSHPAFHVYVSPSSEEYPDVFRCTGAQCDGCENADPVFGDRASADAYADRMAPDELLLG